MHYSTMDIIKRIDYAMKNGIMQKDIAITAGVRIETVNRLFRGRTKPRKRTEALVTKAIHSLLHDRTNLDGA